MDESTEENERKRHREDSLGFFDLVSLLRQSLYDKTEMDHLERVTEVKSKKEMADLKDEILREMEIERIEVNLIFI